METSEVRALESVSWLFTGTTFSSRRIDLQIQSQQNKDTVGLPRTASNQGSDRSDRP